MVEKTTFGAWLKRRRRQLDLTQKGLAYQAGCSVGTIRKIEADERRPSRQLATLLAQHLDIPPDQLEPFIALARSEPIAADIPIPILAPADEQTPAIPEQAFAQERVSSQPLKNNLPAEMTPFLGRKAELATVDELLHNQNRRLVTILGPGGIGKTRLALAYAEQLVKTTPQSHYHNGIFFVDLAPLPTFERIVPTLTEALGLRLQGGAREKRSPKQQLLDYLHSRCLLLLLDNFEHLLSPPHFSEKEIEADGAALIGDILQAAPEVGILVTSRERLNLHMEQAFPIEGLAFPDWDTAVPEDGAVDAIEYPAVQLFLQAAQRSQPNFSLDTREELSHLVRICRLVGGMPLALELAASWVDTLSLMDIAVELQRGLDLLETELRDMPQRQRSVRATFDYSWRKLDEREQSIFAQLSIFRGGFTRPAGQAVTGATLRQLSRLVNKSFIIFNKGRDRYQVHELLRQYGAEWLSRDSELEKAVTHRHSTYYCQALAKYTGDLRSARETQSLRAIEADKENLRLAWHTAISCQDLVSISSSLESLNTFYSRTEILAGIDELEKALTALQIGEISGERGVVIGRLLACLGNYYDTIGQPAKAKEISSEGLDLLQSLGAREETLRPMLFLAGAHASAGALASLRKSNLLLRESLTLAREIGDQWAIGDALLGMGRNARVVGDFETAEQRGQEALNHIRQGGDRGGIAWALQDLANVAIDRGRYEEALALAQETRSLAQEFLYPTMGLWSLGKAMIALCAYEEAQELFKQGLSFAKEKDLSFCFPYGLFHMGKIAFHIGDYVCATQRLQKSLSGALEFDDLELVALNHDTLGRLNIAQGARSQAIEHFQAALQVALPLKRPPILLAILASIAELFASESDLEYAALLATLINNHPASQAKVKERGARLLTRLETEVPTGNLANIRQSSRQADLDTVAVQLLLDLKTP